MAESMVEKAAKAAYLKMTEIAAKTRPGAPFMAWEELPDEQWMIAMVSQRAAIEAMRDASELAVWQNMIDAALSDHGTARDRSGAL